MNTEKLYTPTFKDVIIENPLFTKTETIRTELEKMPEKSREQYLKDNVDNVWNKVKVVKVAKDVTEVREGNLVVVDHSRILDVGMPIFEGKYIQVSINLIKGIW